MVSDRGVAAGAAEGTWLRRKDSHMRKAITIFKWSSLTLMGVNTNKQEVVHQKSLGGEALNCIWKLAVERQVP